MSQSNFAQETGTEKHLIKTYVSDMVALFQHLNAPIDAQLKGPDAAKFPQAMATLQRVKSVTAAQHQALDAHLKALGGSGDHAIKSAWASILGVGAAAVGQVRSTKVSKSLRDDYTALGLAAISFTMLHTTALGLGDQVTASLAKRGLDDVAPLIVEISKVMPSVVLQELQDDGENVVITAAELAKQNTTESWSAQNTN